MPKFYFKKCGREKNKAYGNALPLIITVGFLLVVNVYIFFNEKRLNLGHSSLGRNISTVFCFLASGARDRFVMMIDKAVHFYTFRLLAQSSFPYTIGAGSGNIY